MGQSDNLGHSNLLDQYGLLGQSDNLGQTSILGQSDNLGQSSILGQSSLLSQSDYFCQSSNESGKRYSQVGPPFIPSIDKLSNVPSRWGLVID